MKMNAGAGTRQLIAAIACWQILSLFALLLPAAASDPPSDPAATAANASAINAPPQDRFEASIKEFEARDKSCPPLPDSTVFVGSSTFTLWADLEKDFAEFKAINRGFGGSTFRDINFYAERIVNKYKPGKVVVYAGTNDIAELKHDAGQILKDFQAFVSKVRKSNPDCKIYFVSMSMAPCRKQFAAVYEQGNKLIKDFVSSAENLYYVDILPLMRNQKGELRAELFGADELHMNPAGYALWKPALARALSSSR